MDRDEFGRLLRQHHMKEGWSYDEEFTPRPYWPEVPRNETAFHKWAWKTVKPVLEKGGEVVGLGHEEGSYDRRVVALCNPGLEPHYAATATLFADIQLLKEGEDAPSHHHTPCATRFVMEGQGWTSIEGDRATLTPGDIVHCGPAYWHDHRNEDAEDFFFLDVLDIPLLQYLGVSEWYFKYEDVSGDPKDVHHPLRPDRKDMRAYEQGWAVPGFELDDPRQYREIGHWPYADLRPLLDRVSAQQGSDVDDVLLRLRNVGSAGTVGPTVDICSQLLRPGCSTLEHRRTWATIFICVEGAGRITIDGVPHEFDLNDVFVVPGWAWRRWENPNSADCVVHSISDLALLERLGFARQQKKLADGSIEDSGWPAPPYVRTKPITTVP
ncbi:MAG: cupin domain-containing protein [Proteobacteria bacterium]|nr:cupin domain-containing protein [Pseudomonadota bacterium]MCP4916424.1 cupin domain-containing protein [Pseudomonadota bacterium]